MIVYLQKEEQKMPNFIRMQIALILILVMTHLYDVFTKYVAVQNAAERYGKERNEIH